MVKIFQSIFGTCFGKKDQVQMVLPKQDRLDPNDELEDSFETVPMFDIEQQGNFIRFWPNNFPLWQKLLVIGLMGSCFQFQVPIYLALATDEPVLEKLLALSEFFLAILFYTRYLNAIYFNTRLRRLLDDLKMAWKKAFISQIPEWKISMKETNDYVKGLSSKVRTAINFIGVYYTILPVTTYFIKTKLLHQHLEYSFGIHVYWFYHFRKNIPLELFLSALSGLATYIYVIALSIYVLLPAMFMLYTGKLFEWIKYKILDLDKRMDDMHDESVLKEISDIIDDHVNIIGLCQRYEKMINKVLLMMFVFTTGMCTFLTLSLTIALDDSNNVTVFTAVMSFISIPICDLLLSCWYGTLLVEQSSNIAAAAYEFRWYERSPKIRSYIQLIILRANKPVGLTVGQFTPISLQVFTQVMKTSASYFTLARSVLAA